MATARNVWSIAPEHGIVQGPLDLAFFADDGLDLTLADGQVALIERDDALQDILGSGHHDLSDCRGGRVYFVTLDRPITWQWSAGAVLWAGSPARKRAVPIIGSCSVTVFDAAAFHAAFLSGAGNVGGAWQPVLDTLVRSCLERRLQHVAGDAPADASAIQTLLAAIDAECLTEDLAEMGLTCAHVAVYTRQGPVEDASPAGHLCGHRDNNA